MQTILIVDDDAAIGDLEQEVLERAGYAVERAYSGTEALLLLRDKRPALVLLGLRQPLRINARCCSPARRIISRSPSTPPSCSPASPRGCGRAPEPRSPRSTAAARSRWTPRRTPSPSAARPSR